MIAKCKMFMMRKNNHSLLIIVLFGILTPIIAKCQSNQVSNIESGEYDGGLRIGYDSGTQKLSGILDIREENYKSTCKLFFIGKLQNADERVVKISFFDVNSLEKIDSGTLTISSHFVVIKSSSQITFCQNVVDLKSGEKFELVKKKNIISLDLIKTEKCYVFTAPDSSTVTKKYLIRGDIVSIVSTPKGEYEKFEFEGKKNTIGWIKRDSLLLGSIDDVP